MYAAPTNIRILKRTYNPKNKEDDTMLDYSVVRVMQRTQESVGKFERHIERKNDTYENMNVDLSRTDMNIHFKDCGDLTYNQQLENAQIATEGLQRFIDKAKKVTQLTEVMPEIVHEFIEKIIIGKPEYKDGNRYQSVEIHYNGVRIIRELSPEEMEEYFQEHIQKKAARTEKTA
ncbi:MAG: DUF4368 domain-containing protein [Anaerococcus vaginalis]|nr:DUF4368 domain-containing protein [Anaerococcus vaginalis]